MVNIKINGIEYAVEEGTTILEACRQNGIRIPTLCWLKDINAIGACRICVVEMTGARSLVASCVYPLSKFDEGKNILTHSPAVLQSRKMTLQLFRRPALTLSFWRVLPLPARPCTMRILSISSAFASAIPFRCARRVISSRK